MEESEIESLLNQRYGMLTNPLDMLPMSCELTELDIIYHLMWIDACIEGQQCPQEILKQCRRRLEKTFRKGKLFN